MKSLANNDTFASFFPICVLSSYFLILLLWLELSKKRLNISNNDNKSRQACLIFVSRVLPLSLILAVSFQEISFIMLRVFSLSAYCNKFSVKIMNLRSLGISNWIYQANERDLVRVSIIVSEN